MQRAVQIEPGWPALLIAVVLIWSAPGPAMLLGVRRWLDGVSGTVLLGLGVRVVTISR